MCAVTVGNSIRLQVKSNCAMLLVDEKCMQPDLIGADWIVPVANVEPGRDRAEGESQMIARLRIVLTGAVWR
jgi:hypothetical protein